MTNDIKSFGITPESLKNAIINLHKENPTMFEELNIDNGCDHRFEWIPDYDLRKTQYNMVIECYKCKKAFSPRMINDFIELVATKWRELNDIQ